MYRIASVCRSLTNRTLVRSTKVLSAFQYHTTNARFGSVIQPSNIVTSPYPDIDISPHGLYHHVFQDFDKFGSRTAVVDGVSGQEFSFNQIQELTANFSSGLNRAGFQRGDVLCIVSPNSPSYPVLFYGTIASGGVVSTCNPSYTAEELSFQFSNSNGRYVATVSSLLPTIREAIKGTNVEKIIVVDGEGTGEEGVVSYDSLISDSGSLFNPTPPDLDTTAVLPYSSGTTGLPKGVMLTHKNITSNLSQLHHPEFFDHTKEGTCLIGILPYFHIYGMVVIMGFSLRNGSKFVSLPKFEPETFLSAVQEYKVNVAHLVPPLLLFLAKHPLVDNYNLSSLSDIMTGAAPAGGETVKAARERIGIDLIRQGYGLTETSPVTHVMPNSLGMSKPASVGVCLRSVRARIVSPDSGESLGAGSEGELWLSGPNIMKGYLNRPEATADCITEDGWFKTGDVGYYDQEGCFFITDRMKELIKVKGFQVAPAEIESLLVIHPKIADAAVIGVPNERLGEAPKAYVVKKDETATEDEMKEYIAGKLSAHKHLAGGVEFVEEIPKSPSGKILRRLLRDQNKS